MAEAAGLEGGLEQGMAMKPEVAAAVIEDVRAAMELDRRRWVNTGNPLYVWRAIGACYTLGDLQVRARGEAPPSGTPQPHPFPAWCLDYMYSVALRMDALMEGKDFRQMPEPVGSLPSTREAHQASLDMEPSLNPAEASELVAQALGITSPGRNEFSRLAAMREKELDDFADEALRFEGKSPSEAMSILLQETGINDERTMRRRIAAARAARRAKPPP